MNIGYIGDKGQGKSYMLARELVAILQRNHKWHTKLKLPLRKVAVMRTLGLRDSFVAQWSEYLTFFNEINDLPMLKECDVFLDDISMRLDSRSWELLTQPSREWLYGSERLGCDVFFTAQKFSRVEITFRLLTDKVYLCTKGIGSKRPTATKPQVKRVWGLIYTMEIPKEVYQSEGFNQDEYRGGRPHLLRKRFTNVYDHSNVSLSEGYADAQCIARWCRDTICPKAPHLIITHK